MKLFLKKESFPQDSLLQVKLELSHIYTWKFTFLGSVHINKDIT